MRNIKKILITGGAGFIGSHLVRLFVNKYKDFQIFNLDALTYAGNLDIMTSAAMGTAHELIKLNS